MKKIKEIRSNTNSKHRLFGMLGFVGVFVCGIMAGGTFVQNKVKLENAATPEQKKITDAESKPTCVLIEELLSERLSDENSQEAGAHANNVSIYQRLIEVGCPENKQEYSNLLVRERQILEALVSENEISFYIDMDEVPYDIKPTCMHVEESLLYRLEADSAELNSDDRIERARMYAILAERGCPENQQRYVDLAKQELEIARALRDDEFDHEEANEVAETYKRINMQVKAEEIIDVAGEAAKKLINPTIDFFHQVEKIVNE